MFKVLNGFETLNLELRHSRMPLAGIQGSWDWTSDKSIRG